MRQRHIIELACIAACAIAGAAMLMHAAGYFYLYDDFALLRIAADTPAHVLASTAQIGFLRPLPFLVMRLQFSLQHWNLPSVYATSALILHVVNSVLVGRLGRQVGMDVRAARVAGVIFFLSAFAGEGYFWLSSMFDRMCAFGVLIALSAGLSCLASSKTSAAVAWGTLGAVGAMVALSSKETGVMVAPMFIGTVVLIQVRNRSRTVWYFAVLVVTSAAYLIWRQHLLPGLSGAYGDVWTLLLHGSIIENTVTYVSAIARPPLPWHDISSITMFTMTTVRALSMCAWIALAMIVIWGRPRVFGVLLVTFAVVLLPVIWTPIPRDATASGRFLYVPGIWIALLVGFAVSRVSTDRLSRWVWMSGAAEGVLVVVLASQSLSVVYQARIWISASRLSAQVMNEMKPYGKFDRPLYLANLPAVFIEGPYILKDYAFWDFFGARFKPSLRVRRAAMKIVDGEPQFCNWLDPADPRENERVIQVKLTKDPATPLSE